MKKEYQKIADIYKMVINEKLDYESIYKGRVDAGFDQGIRYHSRNNSGKKTEKRSIVKNMLNKNSKLQICQ